MYVRMYSETCGSHSDVKTFRSSVFHQGRMEMCQVTQKCWYISTKLNTAKDSNQQTQLVTWTQCVLWRDVMIYLLSTDKYTL
jgi:hypothetical protein